jgi:hypothetical protein
VPVRSRPCTSFGLISAAGGMQARGVGRLGALSGSPGEIGRSSVRLARGSRTFHNRKEVVVAATRAAMADAISSGAPIRPIREVTKPSATASFCRLTTGNSATAVPMQARALTRSRKQPQIGWTAAGLPPLACSFHRSTSIPTTRSHRQSETCPVASQPSQALGAAARRVASMVAQGRAGGSPIIARSTAPSHSVS